MVDLRRAVLRVPDLARPLGVAALVATGLAAWGWLRPTPAPVTSRQKVELWRHSLGRFLAPGIEHLATQAAIAPDGSSIVFVDSVGGGLQLMRNAASLPDGARQLTRVVAEMGGKNCVIVDADADLDDAVPAIAQSAFAYAGQKCSAASRILVHEAIAGVAPERTCTHCLAHEGVTLPFELP